MTQLDPRSASRLRGPRALVAVLVAARVGAPIPALASPTTLEPRDAKDDARSVCAVDAPNIAMVFILEGLAWEGWPGLCEELARYIAADRPADAGALERESARRLKATGYFASARCSAPASGARLECSMSPEILVRDVVIEGRLPFALPIDEIRRQVFLRSGMLLLANRPSLADQARLVERDLERQGFFGAVVRVVPETLDGEGAPNRAVRLHVKVDPGATVVIRNLRVEGDPESTPEALDDLFRHDSIIGVPRRFSPKQFDQDVERLTRKIQARGHPTAYVEGRYALDTGRGSVDLTLAIRAGPFLVLRFAGNEKISSSRLEALATFTKAGSADGVEVEHTRQTIMTAYQRAGHFAVRVRAEVSKGGPDAPPGTRVVTYTIDEGPTAKVVRVAFDGNASFSAAHLEDEANVSTRASSLFSTERWVAEAAAHDAAAIEALYARQGFAEAQVGVAPLRIARGALEVRFQIHEGPRRRVLALLVEGAPPAMTKAMIDDALRLTEGAPFVESDVEPDHRRLLTMLAMLGYPRAEVTGTIQTLEGRAGGDVLIHQRIVPGPRSVLGGIFVRGDFRTSPRLIHAELAMAPGQVLDLVRAEKAKQQLERLGVFSSVQLAPLDTGHGSSATWLLAGVEELDLRHIDGVVTFRTDELFSIGGDVRDNDFLGRAIQLELGARLSNASRLLTRHRIGLADRSRARLTAPRIFALPVHFQLSLSYDREDKPLFALREARASASLYHTLFRRDACDLCPNVTASLTYTLTSSRLTLPVFEPASSQTLDVEDQAILDIPNQTIARVGPRLTAERLDSPIDPHRGYSAEVELAFAHSALAGPLAGAAPFWKLQGSLEAYWPLLEAAPVEPSPSHFGGPLVIALGVRAAVVRPLRSSSPVPLTETLAYGGDLAVRGAAERASTVAFPGANDLLTTSLELRWYFFRTSIGLLQVAGFADTGLIAHGATHLFEAPAVSTGGALRFVTPVGPLSLAYAVPVVRPSAIVERNSAALPAKGRLHFSFGYTF